MADPDVYDSGQAAEPGEPEYFVETIIRHCTVRKLWSTNHHWINGQPDDLRFRVKWLGFPDEQDNTWETVDNLQNNEVYNDYCKEHGLSRKTGKPKHQQVELDTPSSSQEKRKRGRPSKGGTPSPIKAPKPPARQECPEVFDAFSEQAEKRKKKRFKASTPRAEGSDDAPKTKEDSGNASHITADDTVSPVHNLEMEFEEEVVSAGFATSAHSSPPRPASAVTPSSNGEQASVGNEERPNSTSSLGSAGSSSSTNADPATAMRELGSTAEQTLDGLKIAIESILIEHREEKCDTFLPTADMGIFALSLCADDSGNLLYTKKITAQDAHYKWPWRMRDALVSGDAQLMKETFDSWCSEVEHKTAESRPEIEKRLVHEMCAGLEDGLSSASMLMAVSWERVSSGCSSASGHPWCGAQKMLIDAGIDVNKHTTQSQWTALMVAAKQGTLCQLATLLKHGADVGARAKNGLTALHLAVQRGYMRMVKWLVWHGADLNALGGSCSPRSPVNLAGYRPLGLDQELVDYLTDRRAAVDRSFEQWVKRLDFLNAQRQISAVHMWPIFSSETKNCRRYFKVEMPDRVRLRNGQKPMLFMTVRFVATESSENNPADVFTEQTVQHEDILAKITVRLNDGEQTVTYVDKQGWVSGLEPLKAGMNTVQVEYERPDLGALTKLKRTCVLVAQPWLCQLNV